MLRPDGVQLESYARTSSVVRGIVQLRSFIAQASASAIQEKGSGGEAQQLPVQAILARQLGMERAGQDSPLTDQHRLAATGR